MRDFGELEARVMDRLWAADGPRTVREVHTELIADRSLAYTTVLTVMDKLHRKGWLDRAPVGRAFAYTPRQTKEQYTADLMSEALSASTNRGAALIAFLDRLTGEEAAALRAALDDHAPPAVRRRRRTGR